MTPSTADQVLTMLARYALTAKPGGRYLSTSPLRPGSNSHALSLLISGPEHGAYLDFVSGEKGSLYDLATKLGIETPRTPTRAKRTLVATYDYVDADGTLVYQSAGMNLGATGSPKTLCNGYRTPASATGGTSKGQRTPQRCCIGCLT